MTDTDNRETWDQYLPGIDKLSYIGDCMLTGLDPTRAILDDLIEIWQDRIPRPLLEREGRRIARRLYLEARNALVNAIARGEIYELYDGDELAGYAREIPPDYVLHQHTGEGLAFGVKRGSGCPHRRFGCAFMAPEEEIGGMEGTT